MLQSFMLILVSIVASVFGQFVLKTGAKQLGTLGVEQAAQGLQIAWTAATNPWILGGLACYALGAVSWIMVLTRVPLSWAYPILAMNQILILLVAWLFLGEQVSMMRWSGALLIVAGVVLVSRS
jgi:multidrug transporter EmrE-like cation transporter